MWPGVRRAPLCPAGGYGERITAIAVPNLYYMPRTRSSRVLWMLEEIGTPYELTEVRGGDRRSAAHRPRHPLGRVPALTLPDGTTIFESAAICLALADLHPEAGLIGPVGSPDRALAYQWSVFAMTELDGPLFRWLREQADGSADSPGRERFAEAAAALEDAVGEGPWLLGDRFTLSDVLCASVLSGATSRGLLSDWPGLVAYVARGQARPAYARAAAIFDRERS